jgi:hypothetical protein
MDSRDGLLEIETARSSQKLLTNKLIFDSENPSFLFSARSINQNEEENKLNPLEFTQDQDNSNTIALNLAQRSASENLAFNYNRANELEKHLTLSPSRFKRSQKMQDSLLTRTEDDLAELFSLEKTPIKPISGDLCPTDTHHSQHFMETEEDRKIKETFKTSSSSEEESNEEKDQSEQSKSQKSLSKARFSAYLSASELEKMRRSLKDLSLKPQKLPKKELDFLEVEKEFFKRKIIVYKEISFEKNQFDFVLADEVTNKMDREVIFLKADEDSDSDDSESFEGDRTTSSKRLSNIKKAGNCK